MRSGVALCWDILNAVERIEQYLWHIPPLISVSATPNLNADLTQDAIIYRLMVIGEAAGKLLDSHAVAIASVSTLEYDLLSKLKVVRRMRDKLIHSHWSVDRDIVELTVASDLPPLKEYVKSLGAYLMLS